jgi:cytochrome c peroxidase
MALIEDPKFKVWVEKYAADQNLFFKDFALAFGKLIGESPWHRVTG